MKNRLTYCIAGVLIVVGAQVSLGRTAFTVLDTIVSGQKIRYQSAIQAFAKEDSTNPPPSGGVLFIGSSIFRQWKNLKEQMAPLPAFNRAFGGSKTIEVLYYMDELVFPYKPKIVVYYCGSNDVNAQQSADSIAGRFIQFSRRIADSLPKTRVFYVSINRAPQKKSKWDVVDSANALVKAYCGQTSGRMFIDVNAVLFTAAGEPRLELYRDDLLHFKDPAYEEFTRVIKPVLERAWDELP